MALPPQSDVDDNPFCFFGNSLTPWDDLSETQKLDCIHPNPLKAKVHGCFAWTATADFRAQWNAVGNNEYTEVAGSANNLQSGSVFRKEKISILSLNLRFLCKTNNREHARPCIIVTSDKEEVIHAAISKIKHNSSLSKYQYECIPLLTGINASAAVGLPGSEGSPDVGNGRATEANSSSLPRGTQSAVPILCGARIGVYAYHGRAPGNGKNVATVGGVFRVAQKYFALTAARAFYHDVEDGASCDDSGPYATAIDAPSVQPNSTTPSHQMCDMYEVIVEECGHPLSANNEEQSPFVAQSIGLFVPAVDRERALTESNENPEIIIEHDLGWALIEIRDTKFWQPNTVNTSPGQQLTLKAPLAGQQPPEDNIGFATGRSKLVTGVGLGTTSGIMLPWSTHELKAWSLECEIAVGDCGSLAFDVSTGEVYGMVIVHDPDTLLTYLLPSPLLFDSIASRFPQSTPSIAELFHFDSKNTETTKSSPTVHFAANSAVETQTERIKLQVSDSQNVYTAFMAELKTSKRQNPDGQYYILKRKLKRWMMSKIAGYARFEYLLDRSYSQDATLPIQPSAVSDESNCLLLVFALLLQHNLGHLLHIFGQVNLTDSALPFSRDVLDEMSMLNGTQKADLWDSQWAYCPITFTLDADRRLQPQDVLPIHTEDVINSKGASARLTCIVVLEEFISPSLSQCLSGAKYEDAQDNLGPRYQIALKSYPAHAKELFDSEVNGFRALRQAEGIVQFLGSYFRTDKYDETDGALNNSNRFRQYMMLLEFGQLDLDEFFYSSRGAPMLASQIKKFWMDLANVVRTVAQIHDFDLGRMGRSQRIHGWHSDIKPDNILLVNGQFKLSDLGFTRFEKSDKNTTQLLGGTVTYGAPETISLPGERPTVSRAADIWSLGCVFSVAATWLVCGAESLSTYTRIRSDAKRGIIGDKSSILEVSNSDSFHDGEKVLPVVTEWHRYLRAVSRKNDVFISQMLDIVDQSMLQGDASVRPEARKLYEALLWTLERSTSGTDDDGVSPRLREFLENSQKVPSSTSPNIFDSTASVVKSRTFAKEMPLDISQPTNAQTNTPSSRITATDSPIITETPHRASITDVSKARAELEKQRAKKPSWSRLLNKGRLRDPLLSRYTGDRHIIFLIDNASSMGKYWNEMTFLLETLIQMLAGHDRDGIEIHGMTGNFKLRLRNRSSPRESEKLDKILDQPDIRLRAYPAPSAVTDPRPALGKIVVDYLDLARRTASRAEALTVIILTDGLWEGMADYDALDDFFVDIGSQLSETRGALLRQRLVSFEFVQFGNDKTARQRLRHLDEDLPQAGVPDIIDTEPSTGDVYKMLLGSFVEAWDYADQPKKGRPMPQGTSSSHLPIIRAASAPSSGYRLSVPEDET